MTSFSCVLVGDESLLAGCGEQLRERGHDIRAVVTENAALRDWAARHGLPVKATLAELGETGPRGFDWLFSIANLRLIPDRILALPDRGAINFHDGPLPAMAGLNTPVWALLDGAQTHAVTWHLIGRGIDTGDILLSREIAIAADETAHSLNSKCYAAGLDGFGQLLGQIETNALAPRPQDPGERRYFAAARRPAAAGYLDFAQPAAELARIVRALDFGGYRNPLGLPRLMIGEATVFVRAARPVSGGDAGRPGEVIEVAGDSLTVAVADAALRLERLVDAAGRPARLAGRVTAGDILPALDAAQVARALQTAERLARHEGFWRQRLSRAAPVTVPLARPAADAPDWAEAALALPEGGAQAQTVAILAAWALQGAGADTGDIAWAPDAAEPGQPAIAAPWLPLGPGTQSNPTLAEAAAAIAAAMDEARRHVGFAADLPLRDPGLAGLRTPELAVTHDPTRDVPGAAIIAVLTPEGGCTLRFDRARLDDAAIDLLRARLSAMLKSAAETPPERLRMADLRALPRAERDRLISGWNDTGAEYDARQTIHRAFEAQAASTPEATALVFEDLEISYAELNARANRAARALQAAGVGRNVHVGLCLRRSTDLLVGALAILKAGGAYVPLDPDHPAARLEHILRDSGARVVLAHGATADILPDTGARVIALEEALADGDPAGADIDGGAGPDDLAYLIYTSGSTGQPKGVMVAHRNVANFFRGMDDCVTLAPGSVWMAVTSIGFDISVLELFYTLARGVKVVIGGETRAAVSAGPIATTGRRMDFSIYFWGNDDGPGRRKYQLLLDAARYADQNGFAAIWTPERHFHAFGGPYPNPAVSGAAVAAVTGNIAVRAGSIVAPLHHPARIAEDWAVIDNLTEGRTGLGLASGWHPHDFVLRPENSPPDNKTALYDTLDKLRRLWRGEAVEFPDRDGKMIPTRTLPRPVSAAPECWVTIAGNPETWRAAGAHGCHVLTHLLGQSIDEVADKITLYHAALREAGHDPADFKVTLMLHSFIAEDRETARRVAHGPMKAYLASAAGLIKQFAWVFPAFKRPKGVTSPFEMDLDTLNPEEVDAILEFAFDRYFEESGLFGTVADGVARAEQLRRIGVTEIACLVDYGIGTAQIMEGLTRLKQVMDAANAPASLAEDDFSLAAQVIRHGVTHLQCTPGMARILTSNDEARTALRGLRQMLIGGEAFPADLAGDLRRATGARILNMYGPTETTVWSACHEVGGAERGPVVPIGRPLANTRAYVLDAAGAPAPAGVEGELCIAGDGVTRGYWRREQMTAERFVPDPFGAPGARMYRSGDIARWRADGTLEFLGRDDHQVKIRGHRIEPGEIEAAITGVAGITEAVVVAREARAGDLRLAGYYTARGAVDEDALRAHLRSALPEAMVPADLTRLDALPLTPNSKIDRAALPAPARRARRGQAQVAQAAASDSERRIAAIWSATLGISEIAPADNFFDLGGHSLLAVQAHRAIREAFGRPDLPITDIFRFPVLGDLARHLDGGGAAAAPQPAEDAEARAETMSKRRAMRAGRERQPS